MTTDLFSADELIELRRLIKQTKSGNDLHVEFRTQHPDCNPHAPREALARDSLLAKLADNCERAVEGDDEVKRGDHIIVTDEDGDESKWLVVWEHEHCVLACEIKLDFYSEDFAAVNNIPQAFENYIDLKNAQEFTVDGTAVRKEQVQ